MSYVRQTWVDGESGGTPLSAARLAHMEAGIGDATDEIAGRLSDASLSAAFVPSDGVAATARVAGPIIGWGGDSHTAGTGATNAVFAFPDVTRVIAGGLVVSPASIKAGVAGNTSAHLLARFDTIIAAAPQTLFVMIGSNDADPANGVSLDSYRANVAAMKAKADAAGIPIAFGTIPPRSAAASATIRQRTNAINLWLRSWAAANGVPLADVFAATVNRTTGNLAAAYDSDGLHLNNAGHAVVAATIAPVLASLVRKPVWPVQSKGVGMLPSNLGDWDNWTILAGVSDNAWTQNQADDVTGTLPAGAWLRVAETNAGGSTTFTTLGQTIPTTGIGWGAGDKLAVFLYARGDKVGTLNKVQLVNESNVALTVPIDSPPVAYPGPIAFSYTVPATSTPTAIKLAVVGAWAAGTTSYVEIGACDVFNLTRMGIDLPL